MSGPPSARAANAAAPSATASQSVAKPPALLGSWHASFDARKQKVELDLGVRESSWSKDDGKTASGKCEIELRVSADGQALGTLRGALGNATVVGTADEDTLNATFTPTDEGGEGMAGTLTLRRAAELLKGELKAASADATLVRSASLELGRAKE